MRLTIGQASELLAEDIYTLRYWEREFAVTVPRGDGGHRLYSHHELLIFLEIKRLLRAELYTSAGVKRKLRLNAMWCELLAKQEA